MHYFLGVDVGTSSVRVGLFNQFGELVDTRTQSINVFNFKVDFYEQSSDEIFSAICNCIKQLKEANEANINPDSIVSIGVDATCSLVVLDDQFKPLSVSPSDNNSINVIMWMDHRANRQADLINSTNHECLKNVGKKISPEMDPPKILWLKQNLYEKCYNKAGYFFSLPDYIVFRLTNQNIRSVCCTTCKWLFLSNENENEWDITFWNQIGLDDLVVDRNFNKIGSQIEKPFKYIEELKISRETQTLTGLSSNVKVGVSMIDAHAGGIGGLALTLSYLQNNKNISINSDSIQTNDILVIVSGTSSCLMASSKMPKFIDGIWGPYYSAMIPNMWLNEAGQSASGKLIDHVIQTHPAYNILKEKLSKEKNKLIYELLNDILLNLAQDKNLNSLSYLTKNMHIYPDFHGNRSPLADPSLTGIIHGISFDISLENLAVLYLSCLQSLAYQTRHIINIMNSHDINFKIVTIIGGLANNKLYCQLISDICKLPVLTAESNDSTVLLGSCICGASNFYKNTLFDDLIKKFSQVENGHLLQPNPDQDLDKYHETKYKIYLNMIDDQRKYKNLMDEF